MKQILKRGLLAAVSRVTGRTAVLLAPEASEPGVLSVVAPYRVEGDTLQMRLLHPASGEMRVLFKGVSAREGPPCRFDYPGPGALMLELRNGAVSFDGRRLGSVSDGQRITARRFSAQLELVDPGGSVRRRSTCHYLPRNGQPVDDAYFSGEDYVDYEAQSEAVHRDVVELARRYRMDGPVLEIGCATGGTLAALRAAGFDVCGVDISEWAVEQARARLGEVVWHCDVERDPLPAALTARGPFKGVVLASVLEHFARPASVLASIGAVAAPAATLIIITTNARSLTHHLLGTDWEGYFDWTHKSVDVVTTASLREWLTGLGWSIRELRTWHLWDGSSDPTHATLRDWFAADARFRALLAERDLGDFITCVAVRR
jgi:2-polyprenyl-3-methyl-5-hydroxy-6-metoxy-1,4-benzoquinol methylase